jgi:hypothetical protein
MLLGISLSENTAMFWATGIVIVGFLAVYIWFYLKEKKNTGNNAVSATDNKLVLAAYERLTLLAERIALPNLISRLNDSSISSREMQSILTDNIKQEYDHNVSQQIYVTTDAWNAVRNLKESNLLAVNQIAAMMPAHATGLDLNKQILEFVMNHPKGNMHSVVQEVLAFEAKKSL